MTAIGSMVRAEDDAFQEDDWLKRLAELQLLDDPRVADAAQRFMEHLRVGPWPPEEADSDWPCIESTYAENEDGYPRFNVPSLRISLAHKFGWMLFREDAIPKGYHLDHKCGNKRCVVHLEPKAVGPHIADHNRARRRARVIDSYREERDGETFIVNVLQPVKPRRTRREAERAPSRVRRPGRALARNRRRRYLRREAKRSQGGTP